MNNKIEEKSNGRSNERWQQPYNNNKGTEKGKKTWENCDQKMCEESQLKIEEKSRMRRMGEWGQTGKIKVRKLIENMMKILEYARESN